MGFFQKSSSEQSRSLAVHIDDDPENLALVRDILKDIGVTVRGFDMPIEGIKCAEKERPSLIILDVEMPGTNGIEICASLQQNSRLKGIPVLMMTGLAEMKHVEKALAYGANGYITKPFTIKSLQNKVLELLPQLNENRPLNDISGGTPDAA